MKYRMNYTLYKRGRFWYYRTYTDDGRRTCGKTTGCTVKSKAVLYCENLMKEGALYIKPPDSFISIAKGFFDEGSPWYLDRCADTKDGRMPLAKNSLEVMRAALRNHILPYWSDFMIGSITLTDIKKWRSKLVASGLGVTTISTIVQCFKTVMAFSLQSGIIQSDPSVHLKGIKGDRKKKDALSIEDIVYVCRSVRHGEMMMVLVASVTGMRASEILAIRRETIFDDHISVKDQLSRIKHEGLVLAPTKNRESRDVPSCAPLRELLLSGIQENGFCFKEYDYLSVRRFISSMGRKDGRNITFHSTRRFFNTYMLSKNVPPIKVAAVMGHSAGASKMQDLYSNWKPEHFPEIYEEQEKLLDLILSEINR